MTEPTFRYATHADTHALVALIEQAYRGRGLGGQLARAALSYALAVPQLTWIDLRAFAHNTRALQLYERLGFKRVAELEDAFRMVDGTTIQDVFMTLRLERPAQR